MNIKKPNDKIYKKRRKHFAERFAQQGSIPTKPRFRSVPDVMDTKFSARNRTAH